MQRLDPGARVVFLTTSIAVQIVLRFGFVCHHVTPLSLAGDGLDPKAWNALLQQTLDALVSLYNPVTLVFDGVRPYRGIVRVLERRPDLHRVWLRRARMVDPGMAVGREKTESPFDQIIVAGELGCGESHDGGRRRRVPPIVLSDPQDLYPRETARAILGLPDERVTAYVQLGAGNLGNDQDLEPSMLESLCRQPHLDVVLGVSPIALRPRVYPWFRGRTLVDFPSAAYFRAFDVAVLAAGYNTVYEALYHRLPCILVPNDATGSDDQAARARAARSHGAVRVVSSSASTEDVVQAVLAEIPTLLGSERVIEPPFTNGASQAAAAIVAGRA
ncbi:MAG: hypothetical protein H6982_02735 [Chromatiales bacterium]|nr:hypothetical protein [Chromatiales bacterium]